MDVAGLLGQPTEAMAAEIGIGVDRLADECRLARLGLGRLLSRDLRGMFDGPSTVRIDWAGRGVVLDVSFVHHDADALTVVMIPATSWLQALMADDRPGAPRKLQVIEECWAMLRTERVAFYLQACWKLCRRYGVANIAVAHRLSDLSAQSDDGTATAKVAGVCWPTPKPGWRSIRPPASWPRPESCSACPRWPPTCSPTCAKARPSGASATTTPWWPTPSARPKPRSATPTRPSRSERPSPSPFDAQGRPRLAALEAGRPCIAGVSLMSDDSSRPGIPASPTRVPGEDRAEAVGGRYLRDGSSDAASFSGTPQRATGAGFPAGDRSRTARGTFRPPS